MNRDKTGRIVIVDDGVDAFAPAIARFLGADGHHVRLVAAEHVAACQFVMDSEAIYLDRERVHAIVFHARPDAHFASQFEEVDSGFCSNEARAAWLGAFQMPGVVTLNRYDAEIWYSRAEWSVWLRRFAAANIPVAPLSVGDVDLEGSTIWLPWGGGRLSSPGRSIRRGLAPAMVQSELLSRSFWCCGEVVDGPENRGVVAVANMFARNGIRLAAVTTDDDERVVHCTAYPEIPDKLTIPLARMVASALNADLHHW